jgi:hypothetical protein
MEAGQTYTTERRDKTYDFPYRRDPQINKWLTSRMLRGSSLTRFRHPFKRRFIRKLRIKPKKKPTITELKDKIRMIPYTYRRSLRKCRLGVVQKNQVTWVMYKSGTSLKAIRKPLMFECFPIKLV